MERIVEVAMPTKWGMFRMVSYADSEEEKMPHLAMVHESFDPSKPVYVRVHSECLTGDLFGSKRCDCGEQLDRAMQVAAEKGGVVVYLRQEGRGIGLINKLKAYRLQDEGLNTIDANVHLGLEVDARRYDIAIDIMLDLGIKSIHLLTNNPQKIEALADSPIHLVSRIPLLIPAGKENLSYLQTKKDLMGHLMNGTDQP
ncbi:MAG: GTP cyclohydrolase II [Bacteroidota bacterium]